MNHSLSIEPGNEAQLTDAAAAREFAARHSDKLRYCPSTHSWLLFKRGKWAEAAKAEQEALAMDFAMDYFDVAADLGKAGHAESSTKVQKFAVRRSSAVGVKHLLQAAQSLIAVAPEELDAVPHVFNVENVTLTLFNQHVNGAPNFEASSADPANLVTKQAAVLFDPEATCPRFDAFMDETFGGDRSIIDFVLRLFGSCLAGGNPERTFPIFWGEGKNGKSTLLNLMRRLFGDYGHTLSQHALLKKRAGHATNDIAELKGVRLAVCTELPGDAEVDTALVKSVTGGDNFRGRVLYSNNEEFTPECIIIAATNSKPRLPAGDEAVWQRVALVPFSRTVAQPDFELGDKLWTERSGILNRLLEGHAQWLAQGLNPPASVAAATAAFRAEVDSVKNFVEDECVEDASQSCPAKSLQGAYRDWCSRNGETPVSASQFKQRLAKLGHSQKRGSGGNQYMGVALRESTSGGLAEQLLTAA